MQIMSQKIIFIQDTENVIDSVVALVIFIEWEIRYIQSKSCNGGEGA